jgi:hypothetical protein
VSEFPERANEGSFKVSEFPEKANEGSFKVSGVPERATEPSVGVSEYSDTGNGLLPTPENEKAMSYQKPVTTCVCVWKERGSEAWERPKSL